MGEWVAQMLAAMTLDEKIALLSGRNLWETVPIERLGMPPLKVTDPQRRSGRRRQPRTYIDQLSGRRRSGHHLRPGTEVGRALAREKRAQGSDVLLGPTVSILRVPNAGSNSVG